MDTVERVNDFPASPAHQFLLLFVFVNKRYCIRPIFVRGCKKSVVSMPYYFAMNSNRIGDHGQACSHVLQKFQATFSSTPSIIRHEADSEICGSDFCNLIAFLPLNRRNLEVIKGWKRIANDFKREIGEGFTQFFKNGANDFKRLQGAF